MLTLHVPVAALDAAAGELDDIREPSSKSSCVLVFSNILFVIFLVNVNPAESAVQLRGPAHRPSACFDFFAIDTKAEACLSFISRSIQALTVNCHILTLSF